MTTARAEARSRLKDFIERVERIAADRRDLGDDMKAVFAEAKAEGFDTKAMRRIIKRRDKDPAEVAEEDSIFETYMAELGMTPEAPLPSMVRALGVDVLAREQVIDALSSLIPANGEIIARVGGEPMRLWRDEEGRAYAEVYVPPAAAPKEKTGRSLKAPATVLTMVPGGKLASEDVRRKADAAEKRSQASKLDEISDESSDEGEGE
ncbi:DUF2312 domain-containing protein [Nitrobacter winogradskyi]|uniref:Uncharacterized protein (UPF0335 family) n=2 Tax=Nitrobacter winogradskyi TaxID=913 RepID=A0ACC6AG33_NITWI|nr:DUF2312 domain-containing protein [Nitrobacter winogradskyi]MCP1998236.1 uncharacterized protein (UPF0335 family) [Nitrobacter winogradskyi]GEC15177.1 hypothetical protein NWI01_10690 [Nitrobacter winogradskyi]